MAYQPSAHFDTTMFARSHAGPSSIPATATHPHPLRRAQAPTNRGPLELPLNPPFFGQLSPLCPILHSDVSRSSPVFPDYVADHLFNTVAVSVHPVCRLTPKPKLRLWLEGVIAKSRCRPSTALVALSYLERARRSMRIQMGSCAVEWAFVGALILANKVSHLNSART